MISEQAAIGDDVSSNPSALQSCSEVHGPDADVALDNSGVDGGVDRLLNAIQHNFCNSSCSSTCNPLKSCCHEHSSLPDSVKVDGARAKWLNQTYKLIRRADVEEALSQHRPGWHIGHKEAGDFIYVGEHPSPKGAGTLPHLWLDARHRQWKIATLGFDASHYTIGADAANQCCMSALPLGRSPWRPGPRPRSEDPLFSEEHRSASKRIRLDVPCNWAASATEGSDVSDDDHLLGDKTPKQIPECLRSELLTSKDISEFRQRGYLVKTAEELDTKESAGRALRAVLISIKQLVIGDKLPIDSATGKEADILDWQRRKRDEDWSAYVGLLLPSSKLWTLVSHMMGSEPQEPTTCQLAIHFPEGGLCEEFREKRDVRSGEDYHIDGRGRIPNNFTLLVGIALNDQLAQGRCKTWGGFTVFPGSHVNSDLHKNYPAQRRGETQGSRSEEGKGYRQDLGSAQQLCLRQGDVIIAHSLLAHRRAENWSENIRCMEFFRLKPAWRKPNWEDGVLEDPFVNLPGVAEKNASTTE